MSLLRSWVAEGVETMIWLVQKPISHRHPKKKPSRQKMTNFWPSPFGRPLLTFTDFCLHFQGSSGVHQRPSSFKSVLTINAKIVALLSVETKEKLKGNN